MDDARKVSACHVRSAWLLLCRRPVGAAPGAVHAPRDTTLAALTAAAGIELESVTDVIITHMHMDHVGAACFHGALKLLAARNKIAVHDARVQVSVSFGRDSVDGLL